MTWHIAIPYVVLMMIVASADGLSGRRYVKRDPCSGNAGYYNRTVIISLGNIAHLPGNIFPWDTLSGVVFVLCVVLALYRKRMFK